MGGGINRSLGVMIRYSTLFEKPHRTTTTCFYIAKTPTLANASVLKRFQFIPTHYPLHGSSLHTLHNRSLIS